MEAPAVVIADGARGLTDVDAASGLEGSDQAERPGAHDQQLRRRVGSRDAALLASDISREVERPHAWGARAAAHRKAVVSGFARSDIAQAMKPRASGLRSVPSAIATPIFAL